MDKESWDKLSAEAKLEALDFFLRDEINRYDKVLCKDIADHTRSYVICRQMAFQTVLWFLEGKLFEEHEGREE